MEQLTNRPPAATTMKRLGEFQLSPLAFGISMKVITPITHPARCHLTIPMNFIMRGSKASCRTPMMIPVARRIYFDRHKREGVIGPIEDC